MCGFAKPQATIRYTVPMQGDVERVLIGRDAIAARLDELAREIVADLHGATDLTIVPILTGSIIFVSDLIRRMPLKMKIRFMGVTSYPGKSTASRGAAIIDALTHVPEVLEGQHVLVVDDILDSGKTLRLVTEVLRSRRPEELRTCVLLRKQIDAAMNFPVDYVAFDIPAEFVVGYGLDYNDYYRNLPDICTLRPEVIGA